MIPAMIFHWKQRSVTICNLAQSPIAIYTFRQMYFTNKASLKKTTNKQTQIERRFLCSLEKERLQLSVVWVSTGSWLRNQRHHLCCDHQKEKTLLRGWFGSQPPHWPQEIKILLSLSLQASYNSNLTSYIVNNPRAISIRGMQEEKIQLRHTGKEIKTSERHLEQGAHRKEYTVQHNLGSVNHSWEMSPCIRHYKGVKPGAAHPCSDGRTSTLKPAGGLPAYQIKWLWLCYLAVNKLLAKIWVDKHISLPGPWELT